MRKALHIVGAVFLLAGLLALPAVAADELVAPVATMSAGSASLDFMPVVTSYDKLVLTVSGPGGVVIRQEFKTGETPSLSLFNKRGQKLVDGNYTYELRVVPALDKDARDKLAAARQTGDEKAAIAELRRAGRLTEGQVVRKDWGSLPALAVARLLRCPTTVEVNDMPYGRGYERRPGLRSLAADRVKRLAVISAAHEPHPMSTAIRAIQRQIVALALESGRGTEGLALARALAMTTYRSAREFAERFHTEPLDGVFPVESYLAHSGAKFAATYPIERFLALSLSGDLHRVVPETIRVPTTLVAAQGDRLVPESQIRELARRIAAPCRLVRVRTRFGHDAFLTEPRKIGRIIASTLDTPLP